MKLHNYLLVGLGAGLILLAGTAGAAVKATKHDLSTSGTGTQKAATETSICIFCHTPHGADASAPVPLWNKNLPAGTSFTTYTSSTMDGTADLASSVSLACLSCHDGTQAMDAVLNKPGAGGYDATGVQQIDTTNIGVMTGNILPVVAEQVAGKGDLSNDHPIGIPYAGGGAPWGTVRTAGDANYADSAFEAVSVTNGRSFADDGTNTLPLYDIGGVASVECASCHDPHSSNALFMRVANTSSAVCVTCHVK